MEVDEQVRILKAIWSKSNGYVFLPWIPKEQARTEARKAHFHNGSAFRTDDWVRIRQHLARHHDDDLYFTPMVFAQPHRNSEFATRSSRLWADLDEVNPESIPGDLTPNVLWETSPGRYAAVWFMRGGRTETTERGGENHRLTIALGADPSGWDTTQLLRVPGSANNKPGYKKGIHGKLISFERISHSWDDIDALPEIPDIDVAGGDLIDEAALESVNAFEAYAKIRTKITGQVRSFLRMKDDGGLDRSATAWQIERELADAGLSLLEMVAIMRPTPWNKYDGRADELKRLTLECGKALGMKQDRANKSTLDIEADIKLDLIPVWRHEEFLSAPDPEWLFDEFVPKGGCGFIAGIPKSLKTWLGLDLGVCAALGKPFLERQIYSPVRVLYIQQEDPTSLVRDRLNLIVTSKDTKWDLSGDLRDLRPWPAAFYPVVMKGFAGNNPAWQVWLSEMIRRHDIQLVIMDTLATVAPGTNIDTGVEVKAELLDPIKEIARDQNCTVCFVHHNTKGQGNDRAGQNMVGSGQIHAWADFGIYIKDKTHDNIITFDHETKYTGTQTMSYKIEGLDEEPQRYEAVPWVSSPSSTKKVRGNPNPTADDLEGSRAPAKNRIRRYIRNNPDATVREIAEACEVKERYVRTVKNGS